MRDRVDRSAAAAPAHAQVLERLRKLALDLPWDQSPVIPAEPLLMERFGVSRGTLRRATAELIREGLLIAERGRGTFVSRPHQVRLRMRDVVARIALPDSRWDTDVTRFVPDFEGSPDATRALRGSSEYQRADVVFATPDNSVRNLVVAALADGRTVLVPTYGLRRGIIRLEGRAIDPASREFAATLDGLERFGERVELGELGATTVDLVVTGAVAVSRDGRHFGTSEAFFEIEWGILRQLGSVAADTPVVCICHDSQVLDLQHGWEKEPLSVDIISTPTAFLRTDGPRHRPTGIDWEDITAEQLTSLYYLHSLRENETAEEHPRG